MMHENIGIHGALQGRVIQATSQPGDWDTRQEREVGYGRGVTIYMYIYIYTVCTDITVNGFTHTRRCHEYDIYFADT